MKKAEAVYYRKVIEKSIQVLGDGEAICAVALHPIWTAGVSYPAGFKLQRNSKLYRCIQAHVSQTGWEP